MELSVDMQEFAWQTRIREQRHIGMVHGSLKPGCGTSAVGDERGDGIVTATYDMCMNLTLWEVGCHRSILSRGTGRFDFVLEQSFREQYKGELQQRWKPVKKFCDGIYSMTILIKRKAFDVIHMCTECNVSYFVEENVNKSLVY